MSHLLRVRCVRSVSLVFACATAALFFHAGCGGSGGAGLDQSLNVGTVEQLIYGDSYAGYLVVHLDESMGARLSKSATLYSERDDSRAAAVQNVVERYPTVELKRSVSIPEEKVIERREYLERLSGKTLADWNSIYHVDAPNPADAVEMYYDLVNLQGVVRLYPAIGSSLPSLDTTPSLSDDQDWLLNSETYGGFNAEAAWSQGVYGQGVTVILQEIGINLDHEDLDTLADYVVNGGNVLTQNMCIKGLPYLIGANECEPGIAHGTANAGILIAKHDDHGIDGFAPEAFLAHENTAFGTTASNLMKATDGVDELGNGGDEDVAPGSIWIIENFYVHPDTQACVPAGSQPQVFQAIQQAIEAGVTVLEATGNCAADLDSPVAYASFADYVNLSVSDSGSIMVGASNGYDFDRASFSGCGSPVEAFGWGKNVVTTSYPAGESYDVGDAILSTIWQGDDAPSDVSDVDSYYTNSYGGTSAALAMVGGVAVLTQSYAKENYLGAAKYLMPSIIKQILVNSGVSQTDGGCNIGKQPRLDVAMGLIDSYVDEMESNFPDMLIEGEVVDFDRMKELRDAGIGIICKKYDPAHSDPSCPDEEIYPVGDVAAPTLDFDADGRADLLQWTNGSWKLDLSGRGAGGDNYGNWDIEIEHAPVDGRWVWPYVEDMNSDGRADFVVYDKEHGKWFIRYTDTTILRTEGDYDGSWNWDLIVDHSAEWHDELMMDPVESKYSRPVVSDVDNDGWLDIAITCSDGVLRADYGGPNGPDGSFDFETDFLTNEQLDAAPGWAYLTAAFGNKPTNDKWMFLYVKTPDGLPDAGRLSILSAIYDFEQDSAKDSEAIFGGNDKVLVPGRFWKDISSWGGPAIKGLSGEWLQTPNTNDLDSLEAWVDPLFGGSECHPIVADFDGDQISDYTVMCPDGWKVMYSDTEVFEGARDEDTGIRFIPLTYDHSELTLPGQSYAGGVSYQYAKKMIEAFQVLNPNTPPPIPIDHISVYTVE